LNRHSEALESYNRAVALRPDNAKAWNNRGIALACLARHDEALESYDAALRVKPDHAEALNNRGVALRDLGRHAEALEAYDRALRHKPDYVEAITNRGTALDALLRHAEALEAYARALRLAPGYAEAWNNRGVALAALQRHVEALEAYERALALKPDYAEALNNRGVALAALDRHGEALASYARALEHKPGYDFLYGRWLHARMKVCDWEGIRDDIAKLESKIRRREKATPPFPLLALTASADVERIAARDLGRAQHRARVGLPSSSPPDRRKSRATRYGLGYFSADFREHACARLFVGLFAQHDRSRFEVTAFSFGPETNDEMRRRLAGAADRFVDVRDRSDRDVALLARDSASTSPST
jgi:predicted O-linked N-acetylglucosamine transferase (SPINDLY family)